LATGINIPVKGLIVNYNKDIIKSIRRLPL
jgi:hypothetical protein